MQNRFKYRAINKKTKEIIYINDYYWFEANGVCEIENNEAIGFLDEYWIDQCTGLKDKNGKLIYEGDVIKWAGTKFVIVWQFYKYALKKDINQKPIDYVLSCFDGTELEVIGNIYENKNLLERTTNER